jgi:uncharacterized protein
MDNSVFNKVFTWMFVGLLITFITGYVISINEQLLSLIFGGPLFLILIFLQFGSVIYLSARINKLSVESAKYIYLLYTALTGATFSFIFILYEMQSIIYVFGLSAVVFGIFAFLGYRTGIDLTKLGSFLIMGLVAIIIGHIVNIFILNSSLDMMLLSLGIIIFLGFIMYDIQKIKNMAYQINDEEKFAIFGALQLYLDFINLFLRLLRLFGRRRD